MATSSCRTTERLSILPCKSVITLWKDHFKSSLIHWGKTQSPVAACHLLANWAFCRLLEWSFLVDAGVLSQRVWEPCQSPGRHWKLSAATVPLGNLICSHFPPLIHRPSLLWHLTKHQVFALRKGHSFVCWGPVWSSSQVVMMPVGLEIVMMLAFSGTLTCFFLIIVMMCQHSYQHGLQWYKQVLLWFEETLLRAPLPWLTKPLLEMTDMNF